MWKEKRQKKGKEREKRSGDSDGETARERGQEKRGSDSEFQDAHKMSGRIERPL